MSGGRSDQVACAGQCVKGNLILTLAQDLAVTALAWC